MAKQPDSQLEGQVSLLLLEQLKLDNVAALQPLSLTVQVNIFYCIVASLAGLQSMMFCSTVFQECNTYWDFAGTLNRECGSNKTFCRTVCSLARVVWQFSFAAEPKS